MISQLKSQSKSEKQTLWLKNLERTGKLQGQDLARAFKFSSHLSFAPTYWLMLCEQTQKCADLSSHDIADIFGALHIACGHSWSSAERLAQSRLIAHLCQESLEKLATFTPATISRSMHALARIGRHDLLVKQFCGAVLQKAEIFDAMELALTLDALATFRVQDATLIRRLCEEVTSQSCNFGPEECSMTLLALARLDSFDPILVHKLCDVNMMKSNDFMPRQIAATLEALRMFDLQTEVLFKRLCRQAALTAGNFSAQDIIETLCALTKSGMRDKVTIENVLHQTFAKAPEFSLHQTCSVLDGLSKVSFQHKRVVRSILLTILKPANFSSFDARGIAFATQALAKFAPVEADLLECLCHEALAKAGGFDAKSIACILDAMATMGELHDLKVVTRFCSEATNKSSTLDGESISVILNSLATLDIYDPVLIKAMCAVLETNTSVAPDHLARSLYSLLHFGVFNEAVFQRARTVIMNNTKDLSCRSIVNMWEVLASFGVNDRVLMGVLAAEVVSKSAFTLEDFTSMLLSMLQAQYYDLTLFQMLLSRMTQRYQWRDGFSVNSRGSPTCRAE